MNIFQAFLRATKQATCGNDSIYVGDVTPELLDSYIAWRREVKQMVTPDINCIPFSQDMQYLACPQPRHLPPYIHHQLQYKLVIGFCITLAAYTLIISLFSHAKQLA